MEQSKLLHIVNELLCTELSHCNAIQVVAFNMRLYVDSIKSSFDPRCQQQTALLEIILKQNDSALKCHQNFASTLSTIIQNWNPLTSKLSACFELLNQTDLIVYYVYQFRHYNRMSNMFKRWLVKYSPGLTTKTTETDHRVQMDEYFYQIWNRFLKYVLFLERIIKETSALHFDYCALTRVYCKSVFRWVNWKYWVVFLQHRFSFWLEKYRSKQWSQQYLITLSNQATV